MRDRAAGRIFLWQAAILGVGRRRGRRRRRARPDRPLRLPGSDSESLFPITPQAGVRGRLGVVGIAGRAALVDHPDPAHVEARPDRGDPGWLTTAACHRSSPRASARSTGRWCRDRTRCEEVSFEIEAGRVRLRSSASPGSGKSTLLNLLGLLDTPTDGARGPQRPRHDGGEPQASAPRLRNELIGFVFQFHYLLPEFSVFENVADAGAHRAASAPGRDSRRAPRRRSRCSASRRSRARTPTSSPAVRSSASRSRARS